MINKNIAAIRRERKMSQADLAKKSKVSQSTIAQIETEAKDPSLSTIRKIACGLGVHASALFEEPEVYAINLKEMKVKYRDINRLPDPLYVAIGKIVRYAKEIGFL